MSKSGPDHTLQQQGQRRNECHIFRKFVLPLVSTLDCSRQQNWHPCTSANNTVFQPLRSLYHTLRSILALASLPLFGKIESSILPHFALFSILAPQTLHRNSDSFEIDRLHLSLHRCHTLANSTRPVCERRLICKRRTLFHRQCTGASLSCYRSNRFACRFFVQSALCTRILRTKTCDRPSILPLCEIHPNALRRRICCKSFQPSVVARLVASTAYRRRAQGHWLPSSAPYGGFPSSAPVPLANSTTTVGVV